MRKIFLCLFSTFILLSLSAFGEVNPTSPTIAKLFKSGNFTNSKGSLSFKFFEPSSKESNGGQLPLVLYLHGENDNGTDNNAQLTNTNGATIWAEPDHVKANPSYIIAPQIPVGAKWTDDEIATRTVDLIKDFVKRHTNVDMNRIYISGFSAGGTGVYKLILKNPNMFAAALVMGANADEFLNEKSAMAEIKNLPIMVIHSLDDNVVPVKSAQNMVKALTDAGNISVLSSYWAVGSVNPSHDSWYHALNKYEVIYNWMYTQNLQRTFYGTIAPIKLYSKKYLGNGVTEIRDLAQDAAYVVERGDKAIIIDTTYGWGDFYKFIRDNVLVKKDIPLDILITHMHKDHVLGMPWFKGNDQVKNVYITKEDFYYSHWEGQGTFYPDFMDKVKFIKDGDKIPFNGKDIEVISCIGHSMGHVAFKFENYVALGDCVGTGDAYLRALRTELTVEEYQKEVQHLLDRIGKSKPTLLFGHPGEVRNKTYTVDYIKDILQVTKNILAGTASYVSYYRLPNIDSSVNDSHLIYNKENITEKHGVLTGLYLTDLMQKAINLPFKSEVTNYEITVKNTVDKINIRPTTTQTYKKVKLILENGKEIEMPFREMYTADLKIGKNTFTIIASEGTLKTTYILTINREQ